MFEEPEEKKEKKAATVHVEVSGEGGDGESYEEDKKMSRLLKFNATIHRHPSQVLRSC